MTTEPSLSAVIPLAPTHVVGAFAYAAHRARHRRSAVPRDRRIPARPPRRHDQPPTTWYRRGLGPSCCANCQSRGRGCRGCVSRCRSKVRCPSAMVHQSGLRRPRRQKPPDAIAISRRAVNSTRPVPPDRQHDQKRGLRSANARAAYGREIVTRLAGLFTAEYGAGFSRRKLFNTIRFAEAFPDREIVQTLSAQLSWSHFAELLGCRTNLSGSSMPTCVGPSGGACGRCDSGGGSRQHSVARRWRADRAANIITSTPRAWSSSKEACAPSPAHGQDVKR